MPSGVNLTYIYLMRIAAIVYIILSLTANFIFDNLTVLVLAMLSFPLLLYVLLKKQSRQMVQPLKKSDDQSSSAINEATNEHRSF